VRKSEGKRPLGRPIYNSVDNIKMHLREIGWNGINWTDLTQDSVIALLFPYLRFYFFYNLIVFGITTKEVRT
jgi:hypothetical protein